jgi:hypothetical protein
MRKWCEDVGERKESQKWFGTRLRERGDLVRDRDPSTRLKTWYGIRLLTKEEGGATEPA